MFSGRDSISLDLYIPGFPGALLLFLLVAGVSFGGSSAGTRLNLTEVQWQRGRILVVVLVGFLVTYPWVSSMLNYPWQPQAGTRINTQIIATRCPQDKTAWNLQPICNRKLHLS